MRGRGEALEIDVKLIGEEFAGPEEIEPPDGIGEEFAGHECPGLAMREDVAPFDRGGSGGDGRRVGIDEGAFGVVGESGESGRAVEGEPEDDPDQGECGGDEECGGPAVAEDEGIEAFVHRGGDVGDCAGCCGGGGCRGGDEGGGGGVVEAVVIHVVRSPCDDDDGDEEGGEDGADVRAGVEDSGRGGALFLWEPFGDGFDGGGEIAGLAETEAEACDAEAEGGAGERGAEACEGPECKGDGVTDAGADLVDEASHEDESEGVGEGEAGVDKAELVVAPADGFLEVAGEDAEDGAVDVIDGGGVEEEAADDPAEIRGFLRGRVY